MRAQTFDRQSQDCLQPQSRGWMTAVAWEARISHQNEYFLHHDHPYFLSFELVCSSSQLISKTKKMKLARHPPTREYSQPNQKRLQYHQLYLI
jgi:hypothetical protein